MLAMLWEVGGPGSGELQEVAVMRWVAMGAVGGGRVGM